MCWEPRSVAWYYRRPLGTSFKDVKTTIFWIQKRDEIQAKQEHQNKIINRFSPKHFSCIMHDPSFSVVVKAGEG